MAGNIIKLTNQWLYRFHCKMHNLCDQNSIIAKHMPRILQYNSLISIYPTEKFHRQIIAQQTTKKANSTVLKNE